MSTTSSSTKQQTVGKCHSQSVNKREYKAGRKSLQEIFHEIPAYDRNYSKCHAQSLTTYL